MITSMRRKRVTKAEVNELIDDGEFERVTEYVRLGGWSGILVKCQTPPVIPQHDIRCVVTHGDGRDCNRKLFGLLRAKQQRAEEFAFLAEWCEFIGE